VVNLSLSLAQAGEKVLLIDADLRRPSVHHIFGLERQPGLTDCIMGVGDLRATDGNGLEPQTPNPLETAQSASSWRSVADTIVDVMLGDLEIDDILKTPGLDNLHLIKAGQSFLNPSEILRSPRFKEFLREVREVYDVIMIDTPPALTVADAFEVAPEVDGVVLVYEVGRIGRGILKRAKVQFENIQANVLGVILNNVRPDVAPDIYPYRYDYYYGGEGDKERSIPRRRWWELVGQPLGWLFGSRRLAPATGGRQLSILVGVLALVLLVAVGLVRKNQSGTGSMYQQSIDASSDPVVTTGNNEVVPGLSSETGETEQVVSPAEATQEPESEAAGLGKKAGDTPGPLAQHRSVPGKSAEVGTKPVIAFGNNDASTGLSDATGETEQVSAMPEAAPQLQDKASEQVSVSGESSGTPEPLAQRQSMAEKSRVVGEHLYGVLDRALICQSLPAIARVRVRPDIQAPVLERIPQGTRLRVVGIDGDWLKLNLRNGDSGWIYHRLVQGVDPTPQPPPAQLTTESRAALEPAELSIQQFVERWRQAWAEGNAPAYIACYHSTFERGGMTYNVWKAYVQDRFKRFDRRDIQLSDLRVQVDSPSALVTFKQQYHTETYRKYGLKTLRLQRDQGHWSILEETVQPLAAQG
jgi:capsular exopolysaccharide synthesis family protein